MNAALQAKLRAEEQRQAVVEHLAETLLSHKTVRPDLPSFLSAHEAIVEACKADPQKASASEIETNSKLLENSLSNTVKAWQGGAAG